MVPSGLACPQGNPETLGNLRGLGLGRVGFRAVGKIVLGAPSREPALPPQAVLLHMQWLCGPNGECMHEDRTAA